MPLTPQDELLCHQLPTTFDHVLQSDLRWTERVVLYACDPTTGTSVMTGLARYPNRNVIDAYAMVTVDNATAHVVRLSREADSEPGELTRWGVGPFAYEVVEPLRRVHFSLEPNDHGVSLDLDFVGDFPAYEQTPAFHRSRGRVREDARRFYQNGRLSGRVDVAGTVIEIDPDRWPVAGRDHSWGTRQGGGGGSLSEGNDLQPADVPDGVFYVMGIFQFDDEIVHFAQREDDRGQVGQFEGERLRRLGEDQAVPTILRVEHDLTFRDDLRIVSGGEFTVHDATGAAERYAVQPIANFWPGLAGYDAYGGYSSGMWRGRSFGDGFVADVTDLDVLRQVSMLSETLVEVRHGDRVGHGLVEMVFMGAYPCYGFDGVVTIDPGDTRPSGDELVAAVQAEVRHRLPGAAAAIIQNWRPADRGFSTETYLFDVAGLEQDDRVLQLVLRRPPAISLFPDYDLRRQVLVMQRLASSALPVPTVRWFDADGGAVGGPYFVMDHIESVGAPSDVPTYHQSGLYLDATPEQRTGMWDACLRMIASVHEVDWGAAGLSFLAPGWYSGPRPSLGAALVDYLDQSLHWADPRPPAPLEAAITYLRAHLHDADPPVLCWGDARLSNLLFDRDLDPVAVLDWEISYLGDHEADVAWFLFTDWASTVPDGIEPLEGTPSREWVLDRYRSLTGRPLQHLHYNEVLAPLLLSVPLTRLGATLDLGDDIDLTGFCCRRIEELLATSS